MDIEQAKQEVNDMFNDIAPMAMEIVSKYSSELDKIFDNISSAQALTNDELRKYMLQLSSEAYLFSMSKDAAILRQECSEMVLKETQAIIYNSTDGTVPIRTNQSLIETGDKQVVNALYDAVANLLKTRLDETHRMINTLNSILISRNAEAKLDYSNNEDTQRRTLNE